MRDDVDLPERMTSASIEALTRLLGAPRAAALRIDGSAVRGIGALPAERLARFVAAHRAAGGQVRLDLSPAMRADLAILGLEDLILGPGGAT